MCQPDLWMASLMASVCGTADFSRAVDPSALPTFTNRHVRRALLQASWGGGGKGIRRVNSDEDVRLVYKQVLGEVPGSPVFTMKLAPQSRHLEVQLLCDPYGAVVSMYSRDCSIQRRHQKIVEEGPATAAPAELLSRMEACARCATILCLSTFVPGMSGACK